MNEKIANYFKALGDKNRLALLELIIKGENCGCTLIDKLDVTQPTMTYHINILEESGLITSKKEGIWRKLEVNQDSLNELVAYLNNLKKQEGVSKC
ncbi:MAG: metalloregulator ArsR/SmtB family transcription factor [Candidatus Izemoplasmatales bacterium]|nr:metalloregulator ArsR/SmtB family transcription factor [Candidatus Izemoplasmatales bacterium]